MKNILFIVTVKSGCSQEDYYIIAKTETDAANKILAKYKEWDYMTVHVSNIKRLAEEGQYGQPKVLLFEDSEIR
jgi:hypothetical protein